MNGELFMNRQIY